MRRRDEKVEELVLPLFRVSGQSLLQRGGDVDTQKGLSVFLDYRDVLRAGKMVGKANVATLQESLLENDMGWAVPS